MEKLANGGHDLLVISHYISHMSKTTNLRPIPLAELLQRSLETWESGERRAKWSDRRYATYRARHEDRTPDQATRDRWAVNYARHHLTSYDEEVRSVVGQPNAIEAIAEIKRRVLEQIAEQWPELQTECRRQAGGV
jgi:hypothetical protein